jgi:hypothetical protein
MNMYAKKAFNQRLLRKVILVLVMLLILASRITYAY